MVIVADPVIWIVSGNNMRYGQRFMHKRCLSSITYNHKNMETVYTVLGESEENYGTAICFTQKLSRKYMLYTVLYLAFFSLSSMTFCKF